MLIYTSYHYCYCYCYCYYYYYYYYYKRLPEVFGRTNMLSCTGSVINKLWWSHLCQWHLWIMNKHPMGCEAQLARKCLLTPTFSVGDSDQQSPNLHKTFSSSHKFSVLTGIQEQDQTTGYIQNYTIQSSEQICLLLETVLIYFSTHPVHTNTVISIYTQHLTPPCTDPLPNIFCRFKKFISLNQESTDCILRNWFFICGNTETKKQLLLPELKHTN